MRVETGLKPVSIVNIIHALTLHFKKLIDTNI